MSFSIGSARKLVSRAALGAGVLAVTLTYARTPVPTDAEAQRAHAKGTCGSLGPGTGLREGKGWVVSMMPGRHEFRVRGGGEVFLTAARFKAMDFDVGRPYYIVVEGARPDAVLEWRILGSEWGPISKYFLYPPTN